MRPGRGLAGALALGLAGCGGHEAQVSAPPLTPPIIIEVPSAPPHTPSAVPRQDAQVALQDAKKHLAESSRYANWDKAKASNIATFGVLVDRLVPIGKRVQGDLRAKRPVPLRDYLELRAATAALAAFNQTKGD